MLMWRLMLLLPVVVRLKRIIVVVIVIYMVQVGGWPRLLLLLTVDRMQGKRIVLVDCLLLFLFSAIFLFQRAGKTERLRVDSYHGEAG